MILTILFSYDSFALVIQKPTFLGLNKEAFEVRRKIMVDVLG
jgi:hypothetical protein